MVINLHKVHKGTSKTKNKFVFLVTEVEIDSLNFISVSFPSETPNINVLVFADDTVLVTSWDINEQLEISSFEEFNVMLQYLIGLVKTLF